MLANIGMRGFMVDWAHPSLIRRVMESDSEDDDSDNENASAGSSNQTGRQKQKKRNSRKRLIGYHNVIGDESSKISTAEKISIAMGVCFVTAVTCYAVYVGYNQVSSICSYKQEIFCTK